MGDAFNWELMVLCAAARKSELGHRHRQEMSSERSPATRIQRTARMMFIASIVWEKSLARHSDMLPTTGSLSAGPSGQV